MHERQIKAAKALLAALHLFHFLHHLAHLRELLDELVDILYTGPTAYSYALAAAAVDDAYICPLFRSHGINDCLNLLHFLAIQIDIDIPNRVINLDVAQDVLDERRIAQEKRDKPYTPTNRDRVVSAALRAYASMATAASDGAYRYVPD